MFHGPIVYDYADDSSTTVDWNNPTQSPIEILMVGVKCDGNPVAQGFGLFKASPPAAFMGTSRAQFPLYFTDGVVTAASMSREFGWTSKREGECILMPGEGLHADGASLGKTLEMWIQYRVLSKKEQRELRGHGE